MKLFFRNNSLSLVFFLLFLFSIVGQTITGLKEYNEEKIELGSRAVTWKEYLSSGHFLESTFENWESEFLQMALFVWFSIYLYQKGSAESKDPDLMETVDEEPDPKKVDAPWPVKKGGIWLLIYKQSLCYSLGLLFLFSFILHWYGSLKGYNEEQRLKGKPLESALEYIGNTKFWFESFQNWESEFLSIFAIIVLSIFLRSKGSAQSKPVDSPDSETGA